MKKKLADRKKAFLPNLSPVHFKKLNKIYTLTVFVCGASCFATFLIQMENYVTVHEIHVDNQLPAFQWNFRVHLHDYGEHM